MITSSVSGRTAPAKHDKESVTVQVVLLTGARVAAAGLSALTALVLARALTKSDFGQLAVLTGIVGFAVVLADAGLTSSVARFLSEGRANRGLMLRVVAVRGALAGLAALGILAYGVTGGASAFGTATLLASVLLLANSTVSLAHGILPTLRRVRVAALLTILVPTIELCGILVAARIGLTAPAALTATVTAAGVGALISSVVLLANPLPAGEAVALPEVIRYALPLFGVVACVSVFGVVDQVLIALFHDAATVAPYALGWKLVMFLHMPALAIALVVAPRLTQERESAPELFGRWIRRTAVVNAGVLAVAAAMAPEVVVIFGDQYRDESAIFRSLMVYAAVLGMAPLVSIACNFLGGARARLPIAAASVVVNIALDFALIPAWGPYGAALSSTIAYFIYVVGHARLAGRLLDAPICPAGFRLAVRISAGIAVAVLVARIAVHGLSALGTVGAPVLAGVLALCGYLAVVGIGALR